MDTNSILAFLRTSRRPVTLRELVRQFALDVEERRELKRRLEALVAEGHLQRVKKQLYSAAGQSPFEVISGRLATHRDGYGFVIPDSGDLPDVFIPPHALGNAVHGDKVRVRISRKRRGRPEGQIVEVLTRSQEQVVGKVFRYRRQWMATPLDERYRYTIQLADPIENLHEGQIVNVRIMTHPNRYALPLGRVDAVLGFPDDPEIQFKIVCYKNQIPIEFPKEVLSLAAGVKPPDERERYGREDLRRELIVTIDGETARDFDDAVSIERDENEFSLGVHIADVSHYLAAEGAIDTEAYLRGTSVYFPDRAIPMLPEKLSNDVCSLKPGEDRLAVSVFMKVNRQGNVVDYRFCQSVICSRARLTYDTVRKMIVDRDATLRKKYGQLVERLEWMLELSRILTAQRKVKGAIDFDLPEAEIEYDVNGEVFGIVRAERNEAHRLIEEFMLLANETVAIHLSKHGKGMVYRIHEEPDSFKVRDFARLVKEFGFSLDHQRGAYAPKDFQRLTEQLSGRPEERFLSYLMLRSFKQARYSVENRGHFGLATPCYTHFTSPIRRYPDLVVHRLLKKEITGDRKREKWQSRLDEIAEQSSDRERKADEAEREIMKWLMAVFMSERLGEEYDGFISGVRENGFFLELLDHFVEGFVHVSKLVDDYYFFDQRSHRLVGENSGRMFRLGDRLRIVVDKVDRDRHLIDFALVEEAAARERVKRAASIRRRSGSRRRR
ncbi:MAG: ribonuclease R [Acidobacteria bacterium]|nr:ribonuclease R [Acidobacteriota bacterium]